MKRENKTLSLAKAIDILNKKSGDNVVNDQFVFDNPYKGKAEPKKYELTKKDLWGLFNYYAEKCMKEANDKRPYEINEIVLEVLKYMYQDPDFNKTGIVKNNQSLKKGLLIYGPYGVGKSMLFNILHNVGRELSVKKNYHGLYFSKVSANDLVQKYMEAAKNEKGAGNTFKLEKFYNGRLYIDDLGYEEKAFNKTELLGQILFERHRRGAKTFVTTNLMPAQIGERYGDRIGDRLPEMFNSIEWKGERKRGL